MFKGSYDKAYKGLDNSMGANNWFLNVIIQSLWHLGSFRRVFKEQQLHKHKKGKMRPKPKAISQDDGMSTVASSSGGGYPDLPSGNDSGGYPSLAPMPDLPGLGAGGGYPSVPTAAPTGSTSGPAYPSPGGYPSLGPDPLAGPPMGSAPSKANTYTDISSHAYPSLDGVSGTKIHEEAKSTKKEKKLKDLSKVAYPKFDDNGNIDCCDENEPAASTQMPYGTSAIPKPDREMTIEESWLFCNLVTLFVNYEYDESNVLTPSHVRQALDSITGNNEIQGFSEGSMACAQETFEEICRYLHREYIKPNYYEKYCEKPKKLKKKEEEYEEAGCSGKWVAHNAFGIDIAENLQCDNWEFIEDVQNTHLDYLINLYTEELLNLEDAENAVLDTIIEKMYLKESEERNTKPKRWGGCSTGLLKPKQMTLLSSPWVFTFAIHWIDPDEADQDKIRRIFKIISPLIHTAQFMKTEQRDNYKTTYVLRGFVSYYGKHYMAYFYSEKHDYWVHFNDSKIKKVGDFSDVVNAWVKFKELPILLFYESLSFLESILPETKKEKQYYNPKIFLQGKNRFWFKDKNMSKELKKRLKKKKDWVIF